MNKNHSQMFKKRVNWFINSKLATWGTKIAAQRHIAALRNALIANTGFLIVGSVFLIIDNFPVAAWSGAEGILASNQWLEGLILLPKKLTFDIMSFWTAALLAYYLSKNYKLNPLFPMISAAGAELALSPLSTDSTTWYNWWVETGIPFNGYAGTSGILLAIVVGILFTEFYRFLRDHNVKIPMPSAVPPAVSASFSAMIPIFLIFVIVIVLRGLFGLTEYSYLPKLIENFLGKPISNGLVDTLGGVILISFLQSFGWCFGINSGAINGIVRPFWMQLLNDNKAAQDIFNRTGNYEWDHFHIGTEDFYNFVTTGGAGSTLVIVLAMAIFARSDKLKTIARLCVIPGIFNINEPWMFGIPVVLNPLMWLPLIFGPVISAIVAYLAMNWHLVHMPAGLMNPWTLPIGALGFFTNLHYSGAILQVVTVCISGAIWYPFMRFYDLQEFRTEHNIETKNILDTFRIAKQRGELPPLFDFGNVDKYTDRVTKQINKLKPQIMALDGGKEKFGLDIKARKLKLRLREIKEGDFDGTKFPKMELIINAKIEHINQQIISMQQSKLQELNEQMSTYNKWLAFYENQKKEIVNIKELEKNHRKEYMSEKHQLLVAKDKDRKNKLGKIKLKNNLEKANYILKLYENDMFPYPHNEEIMKLQLRNENADSNKNSERIIAKNEVKIKNLKANIVKLKGKKIIKQKAKINAIERKGAKYHD